MKLYLVAILSLLFYTSVVVLSFQAVALRKITPTKEAPTTTRLFVHNNNNVNRRDMILGLIGASSLILVPEKANAKAASTFFFDEQIEFVKEPAQMKTDGKIDINAAFVGDYKPLRGMFPHAAGKIASHGPYAKVKDIYQIPDLTENDVKLFKKYENELMVNPPGRAFDERINARVST